MSGAKDFDAAKTTEVTEFALESNGNGESHSQG